MWAEHSFFFDDYNRSAQAYLVRVVENLLHKYFYQIFKYNIKFHRELILLISVTADRSLYNYFQYTNFRMSWAKFYSNDRMRTQNYIDVHAQLPSNCADINLLTFFLNFAFPEMTKSALFVSKKGLAKIIAEKKLLYLQFLTPKNVYVFIRVRAHVQ